MVVHGKNAAFSEPIAGDDDHHEGLIRIKQDELDETVEIYHTLGMRICTHAIGDIAMDMILEAYEEGAEQAATPGPSAPCGTYGQLDDDSERVMRAKQLGICPLPTRRFSLPGDPMVEMLQRRATEQGFPFRTLWTQVPLELRVRSPGYYPVDPLRDLVQQWRIRPSWPEDYAGEASPCRRACAARPSNAAYTGFQEKLLEASRWGSSLTSLCLVMIR